ncbi:WG repeat-containing protein [Algoriphagus aestuariicola]|uniref:WG repeat-containing protein n=1 Tax=Algoriphagus aestuariicola TaxID=1852016 RepID=A0ABS3BLT7_9BACT|nr:WG repeat-containing protein [Algoriphagus aestuariicola]
MSNSIFLTDKTGSEVIPIIYEDLDGFSDGMAAVRIDWIYGFIRQVGDIVI